MAHFGLLKTRNFFKLIFIPKIRNSRSEIRNYFIFYFSLAYLFQSDMITRFTHFYGSGMWITCGL